MRTSPLRHTLAVLRTTIGLGQKEMAELIGRSTRTIQAIELGQLALSKDLACVIAQQTGVSLDWLIANSPSAPIVSFRNQPYTRHDFEKRQAGEKHGGGNAVAAWIALTHANALITAGLLSAMKKNQTGLFAYRVGAAIEEALKGFDEHLQPYACRLMSAAQKNMSDFLAEEAKVMVFGHWEPSKHEAAQLKYDARVLADLNEALRKTIDMMLRHFAAEQERIVAKKIASFRHRALAAQDKSGAAPKPSRRMPSGD